MNNVNSDYGDLIIVHLHCLCDFSLLRYEEDDFSLLRYEEDDPTRQQRVHSADM